jgi:hypothetical protein
MDFRSHRIGVRAAPVLRTFYNSFVANTWLPTVSLHMKPTTSQWQIPIGIQLVPGGLLRLGMLLTRESTRWLAKVGMSEEALKSLLSVRGEDTAEFQGEYFNPRFLSMDVKYRPSTQVCRDHCGYS